MILVTRRTIRDDLMSIINKDEGSQGMSVKCLYKIINGTSRARIANAWCSNHIIYNELMKLLEMGMIDRQKPGAHKNNIVYWKKNIKKVGE